MINKTERIICAWLSLMLERSSEGQRITLNSVLFTLEELAERANTIFPGLTIVQEKDVKNSVEDLGSSTQAKILVKGPFRSLKHYYRLSQRTASSSKRSNSIRYLLVDSTWKNKSDYQSSLDISNAFDEYCRLCAEIKEVEQGENCNISSREAVWIAAAVLTYNEYFRSGSGNLENYYFKQKQISRLAQCYNKSLPIETCNTMTQAACVKGKNVQLYSYLVEGPDSTRRISFSGEDYQTEPQLHGEFQVLTIHGLKPVESIEKFIREDFSKEFGGKSKKRNTKRKIIASNPQIDWEALSARRTIEMNDDLSRFSAPDYEIDAFSDEAFDDPIKLLQELEELDEVRKKEKNSPKNTNDLAKNTNRDTGNTLYEQFFDEIQEMKMSYSYKPILVMAMMKYADVDGKANLSDIIDFFLDYYQERANQGLIIEKADSSFVQHFNDQKVARQTVLIYPYKSFEKKGMMKYNKTEKSIVIVPQIWDDISKNVRREIVKLCDIQLEKYYKRLV